MHLGRQGTDHHGLCDAIHLLEPAGEHLLGPAFQVETGGEIRIGLAQSGHLQHGHGFIGGGCVDELRPACLLGKEITDLVKFFTGIQEGQVHVAAPLELQRGYALTLSRKTVHPLHTGDGAQNGLHGLGDAYFDLTGRRPAPLGAHQQRGSVDIGQKIDRQLVQGHIPEDKGGQNQHERSYGTFEKHDCIRLPLID